MGAGELKGARRKITKSQAFIATHANASTKKLYINKIINKTPNPRKTQGQSKILKDETENNNNNKVN